MTEEQVKSAMSSAIKELKQEPRPLDFERVHERSTAQRLAVHMVPLFAGWDVDCEYDRDGRKKKSLRGIVKCDPHRETNTIFPDILVHHRGENGGVHNLLVIELKKDNPEDPSDHMKLKLLTKPRSHYAYQYGLYINIDGGKFDLRWYRNGQQQ